MKRLARFDLAIYTSQIVRQAIWCGLVYGLLAMMTAMNALPPVPLAYQVTAEALMAPQMAESLTRAQAHAKLDSSSARETAMLSQMKVLDRSGFGYANEGVRGEATADVLLVSLSSLWTVACDSADFSKWISELSGSASKTLTGGPAEPASLLLARWELEANRHYQQQYDYLSARWKHGSLSERSDGSVFQLASGPIIGPTGQSNEQKDDDYSRYLAAKVGEAERGLQRQSSSLAEMPKQLLSTAELTDGLEIRPYCGSIPVWVAFSLLVVGLAFGGSLGWLQLRLHSGGVYDPAEVSQQLSGRGLPIAGVVRISSDQLDASDWVELAGRQASDASRRGGRNLILLGECLIGFWYLLIVYRLAFDSLWRDALWASPLAALGRLLAGMP